MAPDQLIAFCLSALAASMTPGPNNAMLLASGANFGMRRTIPHMAGVVLGFAFMMACVGAGLGGLFIAFPILQDILWAAGTVYLIWLAWKIATATGVGGDAARAHPLTFLQAAGPYAKKH